jgi:hypothetical protein
MWGGTTNYCVNGGCDSNMAAWVAMSSTLSRSAAHKFGTNSGQVLTSNLVANEGAYIPFTGGVGTYTISAWLLGGGGGTAQIGLSDNGIMRGVSAPVTLSAVWQRVVLTVNAVTTTAQRLVIQTDVKQAIYIQFDGVQIEASGFATPYVETNGAIASRAATTVTGPLSVLTEAQGWVAARVRFGTGPTGTNQDIFSLDNFAGDYFYVFCSGTNLSIIHERHSVVGTAINIPYVPAAGQYATVVAYWTNTTIALSVNGAAFVTAARGATAGTWPANYSLGSNGTTIPLDGDMLWFGAGTGTITATDAATLTGYGNTDPTRAQLAALNGGASLSTVCWTAEDRAYNHVGFDYGFKKRCVKGWFSDYVDTNNYLDMTDDVAAGNDHHHYVISSEVETGGLVPAVGLGGQAYPIGSRYTATPTSPVMFDFTAGGPYPNPYTVYVRQDYVHFGPIALGAYHWAGLVEYQAVGGGVDFGVGAGLTTEIDLDFSYTMEIGAYTPTVRQIVGAGLQYPISTVTGIALGNGGVGYTSVPTVSISGGGGAGATAHAIISGGIVTGIALDTPGSGYTSAPTMAITGGAGAGATATVAIGTVTYFCSLDLNMFASPGFADGYPADPKVFACGQGTYPSYFGVCFVGAAGWNSDPPVTPIVPGGILTAIAVGTGGSGYTTPPVVAITGGGGVAATAHAVISGGVVTSVVIDNAGTGYTSAPTIGFSGGGGTGATATATISPVAFATKTIVWAPILTYLQTTIDTAIAGGTTTYMPTPSGAVQFTGFSYAFETNIGGNDSTLVGDLGIRNIKHDN